MRIVPALLIGFLVIFLLSLQIYAAELLPASLRLDRTKISSPISGLVCATPSAPGAGVEGQFSITFPTSFSLSSTLSNWTTDTSGLPAGSTAWPGIGSIASSVVGKTVTFSSNDLTSSSDRYCFYISSSASNTGITTGNVTGSLTTKTAGGSEVDTKEYGLTIGKDQVTLTATVPAFPTDFEAELTKTDPIQSEFAQNETISFLITYGSSLAYPVTMTVQAEWGLGTIEGSGTPTVEVLEYVAGTASNAYNSSPPVIDTVNKTISWTIVAFPSDTHNQTVSFKLRTTSNYTGSSLVTFPVAGRVLGPGTQTPDSSLSFSYEYVAPEPPPSTDPTSTPTPGASTTTAATPTPTQIPFQFREIKVEELNGDIATIFVRTTKPSTLTLLYGTSQKNLKQRLLSPYLSSIHSLRLDDLELDTVYYFQVLASDGSREIRSDLYTFRTPQNTITIQFDPQSLIVTSSQTIIFTNSLKQMLGLSNFFTLPQDATFALQITQSGKDRAKKIQAQLISKNILGIDSDSVNLSGSESIADLLEVKPGVYAGRMTTPHTVGVYSLILRTYGENGSISSQELAGVRVLNPLRVLEDGSKKAIEGAIVRILLLNPTNRIYQDIAAYFDLKTYPLRTDAQGTAGIVLPPGTYRAEVKSLGYFADSFDFTIGPNSGEDYPAIYLKKAGFNPLEMINYYLDSINSLKESLNLYFGGIFQSQRAFELANLLSIITLVALTTLALFRHVGLPFAYLPHLFSHSRKNLTRVKNDENTISGSVLSSHSDQPISGVHVFLYEGVRKAAFGSTITNKSGKFAFKNPPKGPILIHFEKLGYLTVQHNLKTHAEKELHFSMSEDSLLNNTASFMRDSINTLLGRLVEVLLIASLMTELFFGYSFGFLTVLPFLLLSILNLIYYLYYERVTRTS